MTQRKRKICQSARKSGVEVFRASGGEKEKGTVYGCVLAYDPVVYGCVLRRPFGLRMCGDVLVVYGGVKV